MCLQEGKTTKNSITLNLNLESSDSLFSQFLINIKSVRALIIYIIFILKTQLFAKKTLVNPEVMYDREYVITLRGIEKEIKLSEILGEIKDRYGVKSIIGIFRGMRSQNLERTTSVHLVIVRRNEYARLRRMGRLCLRSGIVVVELTKIYLESARIGRAEEILRIPVSIRMTNVTASELKDMSNYLSRFIKTIEDDFTQYTSVCSVKFIYDARSRRIRNFCFISIEDDEKAKQFIDSLKEKWLEKFNFNISSNVTIAYQSIHYRFLQNLKLDGVIWLSPQVWSINYLKEN